MLSPPRGRRYAAAHLASFQPHSRDAAEGDRTGVLIRRRANQLDQPCIGHFQDEDQGTGQPVFIYRSVSVAREVSVAWRLLPDGRRGACSDGSTSSACISIFL